MYLLNFAIAQMVLACLLVCFIVKWQSSVVVGWLVNFNLICGILLMANFREVVHIRWLDVISGALSVTLIVSVVLGILATIVFLLVNIWFVHKREGWISNSMLAFVAGIIVIMIEVYMLFDLQPPFIIFLVIMTLLSVAIIYFVFAFWSTLISIMISNWYFPKLNKDYIVVLGGSSVNGEEISRLLSNRIDKGIAFYQRQLAKKNKRSKLIFSGGLGADKKLSIGLAMKRYAVANGIPETDILIEEHSTALQKNLIYSDHMIRQVDSQLNDKIVFVSSNYHILRVGILARKLKIKATEIGARVPFYYLPTATIREYEALLVMYKWIHIIMLFLTLIGALILLFINYNGL